MLEQFDHINPIDEHHYYDEKILYAGKVYLVMKCLDKDANHRIPGSIHITDEAGIALYTSKYNHDTMSYNPFAVSEVEGGDLPDHLLTALHRDLITRYMRPYNNMSNDIIDTLDR